MDKPPETEKMKRFINSFHRDFLKFLNLPYVELCFFDTFKKDGKDTIVGELTFHEFFKGQVEGIDIYLKDEKGDYIDEWFIFYTYIHEITHYYLVVHIRPPYHGKEFDRKQKFILQQLENFFEKHQKAQ